MWEVLKNWFIDPDPAELEAVASRYAATPTIEDRNRLVQMLGRDVLRRVRGHSHNFEDARNEALLLLIQKIQRWPENRVDNDILRYVVAKVGCRARDWSRDDVGIGPSAAHVRRKRREGKEAGMFQKIEIDPASLPRGVVDSVELTMSLGLYLPHDLFPRVSSPDTSYDVLEPLDEEERELADDLLNGQSRRGAAEEKGRSPSAIQKRVKNLRNKVHRFQLCPSQYSEDSALTGEANVLDFAKDGPVMPLQKAVDAFRERGIITSLAGIRRWIRVGVAGGTIRLRSLRVGGRLYTKDAYINTFIEAMNKAA